MSDTYLKGKQAFSYIRMSTPAQLTGDSLRRQTQSSETYAKKHGLKLIRSLQDIGVSAFTGENMNDGQLGNFKKALQDGRIIAKESVLLVESLDRLSRQDPLDALDELRGLLKTGITIVTLIDNKIYTQQSFKKDYGSLFVTLGIMIRANDESQTKSDRIAKSWAEKRKNASTKKLTSRTPAWLTLNKSTNKFEVDENARKTIKKIFELSMKENMGAMQIARYLNSKPNEYRNFAWQKKLKRGKSKNGTVGWNDSYVKKILDNPAVYGQLLPHKMVNGKRVPTGDKIDGYYPAIIKKSDFEINRDVYIRKRRENSSGRKGVGFSNLFTNIATCGACGSSLRIVIKTSEPTNEKYLRCNNATLGKGCKCPNWQYNQFEESFFRFISEVPIKKIIVAGSNTSKIKRLTEQRDLKMVSLEKIDAKYRGLLEIVKNPNLSSDAKDELALDISKIVSEKKDAELEVEMIRSEISEIQSRNTIKSKDEILFLLASIKNEVNKEKKNGIRRMLHAKIREIVSEIRIYNEYINLNPYDDNEIPLKLINQLKSNGKITDISQDNNGVISDELYEFFSKQHGKRLLNSATRYFVVKFTTGIEKTVHPFYEQASITKSNKMIKLINRARKGAIAYKPT